MKTVLVTGGTGVLGGHLIPLFLEQGYQVYAVRHKGTSRLTHPNLTWIKGDVTLPGIGISEYPHFDEVYHTAGLVNLSSSSRARDQLMLINDKGTLNVCRFVAENGIERLIHVSTAYLFDRNWYEQSKKAAENHVHVLANGGYLGEGEHRVACTPTRVTIHRPGILMSDPDSGVPVQAFGEFIHLLGKVHTGGESVRKRLEGTLHLPPLKASLRIRGRSDGQLNLIRASDVAQAIAEIDRDGVFYLTNPDPLRLSDLAEWVGESLGLNIEFIPDFKPNPIENLFQKMATPFLPYLNGDNFRSDITCSPIDKALVQRVADSVSLT